MDFIPRHWLPTRVNHTDSISTPDPNTRVPFGNTTSGSEGNVENSRSSRVNARTEPNTSKHQFYGQKNDELTIQYLLKATSLLRPDRLPGRGAPSCSAGRSGRTNVGGLPVRRGVPAGPTTAHSGRLGRSAGAMTLHARRISIGVSWRLGGFEAVPGLGRGSTIVTAGPRTH